MGCVSGQDCRDNEKPVHEVKIDSFALSKYEVTFEEYKAFTDATERELEALNWKRSIRGLIPDEFFQGRYPAFKVSWEDAVAYTQWLSSQMGERYRLPSESEWEYVARAGTETAYSWGDSIGVNRAKCDGCGNRHRYMTAPVGSFEANAWGVYDIHGNVWEWVQDCWNDNYAEAPADGSAWESGNCSVRVLRGGSWTAFPWYLRSAYRGSLRSVFRNHSYGFRVARSF